MHARPLGILGSARPAPPPAAVADPKPAPARPPAATPAEKPKINLGI